MIIDLILDRKDGCEYSAREFYYECMEYGAVRVGPGYEIARAMDGGGEGDVRRELCKYIDDEGYNPAIKDYVNSVNWL